MLKIAPSRNSDLQLDHLLCPPDKSLTHRALLFSGIAKGQSRIINPLLAEDCNSTGEALRALGVRIEKSGLDFSIDSPGISGWSSPADPIDFGNSGTTARLMIGLLAACKGIRCRTTGDQSLSQRPMLRVVEPLRRMGARIEGREGGRYLPLEIEGAELSPISLTINKASAQVKSALLLAGLSVKGRVSISLPTGARDHTEKLLKRLGAKCWVTRGTLKETLMLDGPFQPPAQDFRIPGDPSSAAFLAVYAALKRGCLKIEGVLANRTRTGFVAIMRRMGVHLLQDRSHPSASFAMEETCDLKVERKGSLAGVEVSADEIPACIDEIPILAMLAAFARGSSIFHGLAELRVKESDRLAKILELLQKSGAEARIADDSLYVAGGLTRPRPFEFDPAQDHRLAMAAAVMAKFAEGHCLITDASIVDVSFPGFFDILSQLG